MGRMIDADNLRAQYKDPEDIRDSAKALYHVTGIWAGIDAAETVEAIPVDYLNSRINDFRQRESYAGRFAADLLEAIIKDYNKEAHNGKTE